MLIKINIMLIIIYFSIFLDFILMLYLQWLKGKENED